MTGRHLDLIVYPLSFKEFLKFKGVNLNNQLDFVRRKTDIKNLFDEYLEFGGFPEVVLGEEKKRLLLTYFEDILVKDIKMRYDVREKEKLDALARFYLSNIGSSITFNSIRRFLNLSVDSIERFTSYFVNANLIFLIKKFSFTLKEQEKSARKVYSVDLGLADAIGFRFSKREGFAFKNLVAVELRRYQNENPAIEIYYWKDNRGREVDFVVKENS